MDNTWQVQEAKSKFSELVEKARTKGAQIVTRRGEKTVVVIQYEEYKRLTQVQGKFSEFMENSPLAGADITVERLKDKPRVSGF